MTNTCNFGFCHPAETGCNLGHTKLADCSHYSKGSGTKSVEEGEENFSLIPWTGNSFGLQDLNFLAARNKLTIIGVVGSAGSGKTTFLAALYCLLRNGSKIGDFEFAGSLTLIGWENIAWFLSWKPEFGIQFPLHTSFNSGREPGLLHLSLRDSKGRLHDVVFTDAPGEWFSNWAINKDDESSKGAEWTHLRADGFLLFADSESFSGSGRGTARFQIRQLIERLKDGLANRPFGLVWSKSDHEVIADVKTSVKDFMVNSEIGEHQVFDISILEEKSEWRTNILESVNWVLTREQQLNKLPDYVAKTNDKFFEIR